MINVTSKQFIIANLEYRLSDYYPKSKIQVGKGNTNADIVIVQPSSNIPDRDAITGALKRFGMLDDAYRTTSLMVDCQEETDGCEKLGTQAEINRYYLRELIQIIDPILVVACGPEVVSLLKQKNIRSFQNHTGKKFKIKDLTKPVFYAIINPTEYGYARAPINLKTQGKNEWEKLHSIYTKLRTQVEQNRWVC